jgi:hypothetical protein
VSKSNSMQAESPEGPTQAANCELASQSIEVVKFYKNSNKLVWIISYKDLANLVDSKNILNLSFGDYYMTPEFITLKEYETYKTLFGE